MTSKRSRTGRTWPDAAPSHEKSWNEGGQEAVEKIFNNLNLEIKKAFKEPIIKTTMRSDEPLKREANDKQIEEAYDRFSTSYSLVVDRFSEGLRDECLRLLDIMEGESVLELGFGSGKDLVKIADKVGNTGEVYGIDKSEEMVKEATNRIEAENLGKTVDIERGDARDLPYEANYFDAVYTAEVLELFESEDIPVVLDECKRVLNDDGRLGVVSMEREGYEDSFFVKGYEWIYENSTFYNKFGCRPIYLEESLKDSGFVIDESKDLKLFGICPMKIVVASEY